MHRTPYKFYILTLFLVGFFAYSPVAEARCTYKNAKVNVKQTREAVRLDRSFSANQLTATSSAPVAANNIVLGHGGGEMQIGGNIEFSVEGNAQQGYCPIVRQVNIEIIVRPMIKLASSLRPGTCEYNAVYQHEQFHVHVLDRAAQQAVQQIPSIINSHLRNLVRRDLRQGNSPQALNTYLQAEFSRTLSSINDQMSAHINNEQKKVDNPTEYARVQNSCSFDHVH